MTAGHTAPLFSVDTARPGCVDYALLVVAGSTEEAIAAALVERPDAEVIKVERSGDIDAIEAHALPLPFFLVTPVEGLALGVAATTAARALELAKHRCPGLEVRRIEQCGTLVAVPPGCPALVYEAPTAQSALDHVAKIDRRPQDEAVSGVTESEGSASPRRTLTPEARARMDAVVDGYRQAATESDADDVPANEAPPEAVQRANEKAETGAEPRGPWFARSVSLPMSARIEPGKVYEVAAGQPLPLDAGVPRLTADAPVEVLGGGAGDGAPPRLDAVVDGYRPAPRTAADIRAEIYGLPPYTAKLKHRRNQSGEPGPCEPDCRKCALPTELLAALGTENEDDLVPAVEAPSEEEQRANATAESRMDRRMAAADRHAPPTIESTNDAAKLANLLLGFRGAIARALGEFENASDETLIKRADWLRGEVARGAAGVRSAFEVHRGAAAASAIGVAEEVASNAQTSRTAGLDSGYALGERGVPRTRAGELMRIQDEAREREAKQADETAADETGPLLATWLKAREARRGFEGLKAPGIGQQPTDQTAEECGINALKWAAAFCEVHPHPDPAALRALMAGWFALAIQRALDLAGKARVGVEAAFSASLGGLGPQRQAEAQPGTHQRAVVDQARWLGGLGPQERVRSVGAEPPPTQVEREQLRQARGNLEALKREAAGVNERDGVIAFLMGVLDRVRRSTTLSAAWSYAAAGEDRIARWHLGTWQPGPHDDPAQWAGVKLTTPGPVTDFETAETVRLPERIALADSLAGAVREALKVPPSVADVDLPGWVMEAGPDSPPPAGAVPKTADELKQILAEGISAILGNHIMSEAFDRRGTAEWYRLRPEDVIANLHLWERLGTAQAALGALKGYAGTARGFVLDGEKPATTGVLVEPSRYGGYRRTTINHHGSCEQAGDAECGCDPIVTTDHVFPRDAKPAGPSDSIKDPTITVDEQTFKGLVSAARDAADAQRAHGITARAYARLVEAVRKATATPSHVPDDGIPGWLHWLPASWTPSLPHQAMISGLARAAARYEQTGLMVRGDGSLWDDDMRNALAAAREAGLAPPPSPLDPSAARALWVPPDAIVLTDADARAYREFQRASIAMEDAHRAYADRQREHSAAMVTLGRAAAASGRAAEPPK